MQAIRYSLAATVALVTASLLAVLTQLSGPFALVMIIVTELFMDLLNNCSIVADAP